jgi:hypothetical protein
MKHLKTKLEEYLNEVRYIGNKFDKDEQPLKDNQTIRVYHGFNKMEDVEKTLRRGLSGKEKAKRIYSYESGNNPSGLFVTVDYDAATNFASSGVVIEFSTKVKDLEAPVWVGGRSYFVQGEFAKSFKDLSDREQQRLINREESTKSEYPRISKSDRPELAEIIFDNPERQALFVGDLDPNMIKYVWYNEKRHKENLTNGKWVRMKRKKFINKLNIETSIKKFIKYYPNDEFDYDEFVDKYFKGNGEEYGVKDTLKYSSDYDLKNMGFFPKQIEKINVLKSEGFFDD